MGADAHVTSAALRVYRELEAIEAAPGDAPFPADAWADARGDVAAGLPAERFLAVEAVYAAAAAGDDRRARRLAPMARALLSTLARAAAPDGGAPVERTLVPEEVRAPCWCGHALLDHAWVSVRRRVALRQRDVATYQRGEACTVAGCDCRGFRGVQAVHNA